MRKGIKVLIGLALIITTLTIGFFIFRNKIIETILYTGPRDPKNQIETTFDIGWWSHQDGLIIDNLEIEIVDSRLNLFNSKSLISYTISGMMTGSKNWEPYLKKIHLSERFVKTDSTSHMGLIELTPLIGVRENSNYVDGKVPFKVTNELLMESFHWGNNPVLFKCEQIERRIELKQRK
jgi:hypothetical protein